MKQYIPKKIVNSELTDKQRSELKLSLEDRNNWEGSFIKEPGLFIGQIIEFLGDDWWNSARKKDEIFPLNSKLCNRLFEAVKYKLNN